MSITCQIKSKLETIVCFAIGATINDLPPNERVLNTKEGLRKSQSNFTTDIYLTLAPIIGVECYRRDL